MTNEELIKEIKRLVDFTVDDLNTNVNMGLDRIMDPDQVALNIIYTLESVTRAIKNKLKEV